MCWTCRSLYRGLLLYALLAGLIGNLAMLPRIQHPWGGFFVQWQQQDQALAIIPGNSPSAPGLQSGTLQRGDIIRSVGDINVRRQPLPEIYEALYADGARTVHYVVQRGADLRAVEGPLLLFGLPDLIEARAVYVLLALAAWLLGWIVLNASPSNAANRSFSVFVSAAVMMVLPGNYYFNNGHHDVLGLGLTMATTIAFAPLIGAALLRFALAFPSEIGQRWAWAVYLPALVAIAVHEYASAHTFHSTPALNIAARGVTTFNVAYAVLGFGVLLARCVQGLLERRSSPRVRHQLVLVLLGFACGVLLPGLPYGTYLLRPGAYHAARLLDQPLIAFLFPAAIAYAVLRYQMFRGRSRALFTLIMLAFGALLAQFGSLSLAVLAPKGVVGQNTLVAGVIAVSLLTSLFWQGEGGLPRILNRLLRREQTHYRALSNLLAAMGQVTALPVLARQITAQLAADFAARYVNLWLIDEKGDWTLAHQCVVGSALAPAIPPADTRPPDEAVVRLVPDPDQAVLSGASGTAELAAIIPLIVSIRAPTTQPLGALVLGPPRTGDIYDDRDLQLFAVIGEQVAASLVIAQQVEHLKREPQRILVEVERERERIARELHDTVQQEMGALPYLLESIQVEVRNSTPAQHLFDEFYRRVGRVSLELHNLRHDISPPELWAGDYTQALRELMYRKLAAQGIACTLAGSLPAALDRTQATALYRICQQAFDNILQHACAHAVRVMVQDATGQHLCLRIEDDGCGLDTAQLPILAQGGHAGVLNMRERTEALDGEFRISSVPGKGTIVEITLPLAGTKSVAQASDQ